MVVLAAALRFARPPAVLPKSSVPAPLAVSVPVLVMFVDPSFNVPVLTT